MGTSAAGHDTLLVRPAAAQDAAGVATLAAACDGSGACPALQTQACGSFACGPSGTPSTTSCR